MVDQRKKAQTELVNDIYQAFFYRALPRTEATARKAAWYYDYARLLAYDASLRMVIPKSQIPSFGI